MNFKTLLYVSAFAIVIICAMQSTDGRKSERSAKSTSNSTTEVVQRTKKRFVCKKPPCAGSHGKRPSPNHVKIRRRRRRREQNVKKLHKLSQKLLGVTRTVVQATQTTKNTSKVMTKSKAKKSGKSLHRDRRAKNRRRRKNHNKRSDTASQTRAPSFANFIQNARPMPTGPISILHPNFRVVQLFCYEPGGNGCVELVNTRGKMCYLNYVKCRTHYYHQLHIVYYDKGTHKCIRTKNILKQNVKIYDSFKQCADDQKRIWAGLPEKDHSPTRFMWRQGQKKCLQNTGASTQNDYENEADCLVDNAPRYCYDKRAMDCLYEPTKSNKRLCFPDKKSCATFRGISSRWVSNGPSLNTQNVKKSTHKPTTAATTTTTTTTTQKPTTTVKKSKRPATKQEANNLFMQCCLNAGISEQCASSLCSYDTTGMQVGRAYSPWYWVAYGGSGLECDITKMKAHYQCAANNKNNMDCCMAKNLLPNSKFDRCKMFCDPNGAYSTWPTGLDAGLQVCEKTHVQRYECHYANSNYYVYE